MPVVVPSPLLDEGYAAYASRLSNLGLRAHSVVEASPDYSYSSNAVADSVPSPGSRAARGTDVEVDVNPTYDDPDDQTCDRSVPPLADPRTDLGYDPAVAGQYDLISVPGFASSFAAYGGKTAYFRWGRTRPQSPTGKPWDGWGYRHA
jgi:hypothetical protein